MPQQLPQQRQSVGVVVNQQQSLAGRRDCVSSRRRRLAQDRLPHLHDESGFFQRGNEQIGRDQAMVILGPVASSFNGPAGKAVSTVLADKQPG